ncbi:Zinc finger protein, partial [Armadillidium nasatum]
DIKALDNNDNNKTSKNMLEQNVYTEIIKSRQPIVLIKKLVIKKKIFVNEARGDLTILEEVNGNRPGTYIISSKKVLNTSVHDKKATSSLEKITKNKNVKESQEKVLQCSLCSYHTYERKNLSSHMRTHRSERPFKCSICSYSGKRKEHLQKHLMLHSGQKII